MHVSEIMFIFAAQIVKSVDMAYAKINIVIKNPSSGLEERIREVGRQKFERMQRTLQDWREGKYKDAKVLMVK